MQGTALAEWMQEVYHEELKKLTGFYGLSFWNRKRGKYQKTWSKHCNIHLDGACGFSCMERILNKLGHKLKYIDGTTNTTTYLLI